MPHDQLIAATRSKDALVLASLAGNLRPVGCVSIGLSKQSSGRTMLRGANMEAAGVSRLVFEALPDKLRLM